MGKKAIDKDYLLNQFENYEEDIISENYVDIPTMSAFVNSVETSLNRKLEGVTVNDNPVTINNKVANITINEATTENAGLLSAADKTKLNNIDPSGATVSYSPEIIEGTKIGTLTINGSPIEVYVPEDENTIYNNATTTADGLMSSDDKTKLDGIAASADAVSFTQTQASGTKIGTILINSDSTDLYAPNPTTESDIAGMGFTKNTGTITGIVMNGASKGSSGVVDLGTVITDVSGKQNSSTAVKYGGSAAVGSTTKGVYVDAAGNATAMTYELNKTVPADAKFTDTTYEVLEADKTDETSGSLVTPLEKYDWNEKIDAVSGGTGINVTTGAWDGERIVKANLKSMTASTLEAASKGSTTNREYAVGVDINGHLSVNVPWTDNNTEYTAATAAPGNVASSSAVGTSTNYARQDHTHGISVGTGDSNGQVKVAGINASVKGLGSAAYTNSDTYIAASAKGAASGVAELDSSGKVPSSQLPAFVDDVLEYTAKASFPATGETGKIYVDTTTNLTYRWSGTAYVEISPSLALGETSSTAYRGDRGKSAYDHASAKGSAFSSGLYKITTNAEGHVTAASAVAKSDITALGIPGSNTNTTYTLTQDTTDGHKFTFAGSDGTSVTITIPDNNTTYTLSSLGIGNVKNYDQSKAIKSITRSGTTFTYTCLDGTTGTFTQQDNNTWTAMVGATSSANGTAGYVPTPPKDGYNTKYLRADGTWSVPAYPTVNNATLTIQKNGTNVQTFTANQSSNATANITVPTKVSELTNDSGFTTNTGTITGIKMNGASKGTSGVVDLGTVITAHQDISGKANTADLGDGAYKNSGVYYGTCATAAATKDKVVSVSADQKFTLKVGAVVHVKYTNTNTYSATADNKITLNVNSTGAKNIYYGTGYSTGTNTTAFGAANWYMSYMYNGTDWVWVGLSGENNTTYSAMSSSELTTGTATSLRTVRADYLKTGINSLIDTKINALDVTGASGIAASKTISAWSETNGKVSISTQDISITKSQVSDFPTSMTPTSHTHGNIQNGGTLQTNDITIASGDKLVVTDSSDSNKVARTSISFDGSTATKALTQKGTWESFTNNAGTITGITMNGASKGTSGIVDLGTVLTSHQDISGKVNKSGDTMTGNLTIKRTSTNAQNYPAQLILSTVDSTNSNNISTGTISAYQSGANGSTMVISPAGNMFIGSGEAAANHYGTGFAHNEGEVLYLTSDNQVHIQANGQTIANRLGLQIDNSGNIIPDKADAATNGIGGIGTSTYRWNNIYSRSFNELITGSGTAATTSGSNYIPAKWTFNIGRAPVDGDIITIKIPVAGHDYGVFLSINNGTNYHPIRLDYGTGRLTTHFGNGQYITLVYTPNATVNSVFPLAGGTARTNITGCWTVLNYYNTNTDVRPSAYCDTAAGTAAKTASCTGYNLLANSYIHVIIVNTNTYAGAITLNINGQGAKPIYINGTASSSSNYGLTRGSYLVYYNGTNYYFRTDGKLTGAGIVDIGGNTSKFLRGDGTWQTVLTSHQDISGKADKSATVSTVAWDSTNKKITKTINGTTSDVVTAATILGNLTKAQVTTALGYTPPTSDTNTHRPIQVNGTEILGNNTTPLNLKAGSNVSLSNSNGTVTIAATDTNTDTKVTQNLTDVDSSKPVLLGYTAWGNSETNTAYKSNMFTYNPKGRYIFMTGNVAGGEVQGLTMIDQSLQHVVPYSQDSKKIASIRCIAKSWAELSGINFYQQNGINKVHIFANSYNADGWKYTPQLNIVGDWNNYDSRVEIATPLRSITNTLHLQGSSYLNLRSPGIQCRNYADTAWAGISASAFSNQSSRRYKDNIKDISEDDANKILDIRVVSFDYKENVVDTERERYNRHGVIAEEVNDIIPEVVFLRKINEDDKEAVPDTVDYSKFVPYLIKMVQMQQKEIDDLKQQIIDLSK